MWHQKSFFNIFLRIYESLHCRDFFEYNSKTLLRLGLVHFDIWIALEITQKQSISNGYLYQTLSVLYWAETEFWFKIESKQGFAWLNGHQVSILMVEDKVLNVNHLAVSYQW